MEIAKIICNTVLDVAMVAACVLCLIAFFRALTK